MLTQTNLGGLGSRSQIRLVQIDFQLCRHVGQSHAEQIAGRDFVCKQPKEENCQHEPGQRDSLSSPRQAGAHSTAVRPKKPSN